MAPRYCTCKSLLNGCHCSFIKPRTVPINILLPELGFKRAWAVIQQRMESIETKRKSKIRVPSSVDDLMYVMSDIERYSIALYEEIARDLEDEWRHGRLKDTNSGSSSYTFSFNLNDDSGWYK